VLIAWQFQCPITHLLFSLLSSNLRSPMTHAANSAVSAENNTIPTTIKRLAINRPSRVIGNLSPYPTVVTDAIDHQMASPKVFMFEPATPRSASSAAIADVNRVSGKLTPTIKPTFDALVLKNGASPLMTSSTPKTRKARKAGKTAAAIANQLLFKNCRNPAMVSSSFPAQGF